MGTNAAITLERLISRDAAQGRENVSAAGGADAIQAAEGSASGTRLIPTASLFDAVGVVLDLSLEGRDLIGTYASMKPEDRGAFVDMLTTVMDSGVVGNETLEIAGKPYSTDAVTRLGDNGLLHANPYRGRTAQAAPHMDVLA